MEHNPGSTERCSPSRSDPATGVLVNRLGIADPEHLQQVEADLSNAALAD